MFIINKNSIFLSIFLLAISLPSYYFHPILVVIAFDGFKPDYVNSTLTPNMYKLATNGVQGMMKPQFMSKTYPNLQSIATGLYEDVHGIVNNDFYDPIFKRRFKINDDFNDWWDNNVSLPVWIANQMQNPNEQFSGVDTWTGVQASYRNIKPKHTLYYNPIFMKNGTLKIDAIINWLTNSSTPANCIFSYFDEPDYTSHNYGSFNNETLGKVKQIDKIVGYLIQKLNQTNLLNKKNLILLSDHGMTDIIPERVINLNSFLNESWYEIYGSSPVWSIEPKHGYEDAVFSILKNHSSTKHYRVYRRNEIPEEYHYRNNRRILSILLEADEGWDVFQNMTWKYKGSSWGNHGYNNSLASMRPLFIGNGPAFKKNYLHNQTFENVDLYSLINYILELFPISKFPSNGSFDRVSDMLINSNKNFSAFNLE